MYYNIDKIRGITLNRIPADDPERLAAVKQFLRAENLIEAKILSTVYLSKSSFHIDKPSFDLLVDGLYQFGLKKKSHTYEKCHISDFEKAVSIETLAQFQELENFRRSVSSAKKQEQSKIIELFNHPLPVDLTDKKLMSIDFEFVSNGNDIQPLEMGISIQMNGERSSFNYSFDKDRPNRFNYGETIYVDKSELLQIFKEHLVGCDYLVGHHLMSEFLILNSLGMDESFWHSIPLIDTACVSKNEFHFLNCGHVKNEMVALRTALRIFDIPYLRLHVAGNDAAYTLDALEQMVIRKSNFNRIKDSQKIQVQKAKKQKKPNL